MAYYHLTGAGGVGMSALAVSLKGLGNKVTGSDRNLSSPNVKLLESQGIRCFPDDGTGVVDGVDALVVSTAIEKSNLDFVAAKEKELALAITQMLGIRPSVHLVAPKSIARSEGKAVRVVDKRKLHD
jgi:UDP-N-acetylmuramate-alanine ligase